LLQEVCLVLKETSVIGLEPWELGEAVREGGGLLAEAFGVGGKGLDLLVLLLTFL
jgi:hypothetical protein